TAGMINVTVTDDDVLDFLRIQPELRQALDNLVFNRIVENRINNDDPVRGIDGPGRIFGHPDEIKIIEDFYRLRMPLLTTRRPLWLRQRRLPALPAPVPASCTIRTTKCVPAWRRPSRLRRAYRLL